MAIRTKVEIALRAVGQPATLLIAALAAPLTGGYEIDPYTNRDVDVGDSLTALDVKVNAALDDVAASWSGGEDEWRMVTAIYRQLGGLHWVDKLERWAMDATVVEKIPNTRAQSVVSDFPFHAARVAWVFGFGPTIRVNGVYIGTDKIGHFFSQGRKFYRRYRRMGDETQAARWSIVTETGLFGRLTTGVLSNADLVANYEGYRFYRSLFEAGVVHGKAAIFRWLDDRPVRQRAFTWADHINPFWDEALNPNAYSPALLPYAEARMLRLCNDFARRPERYGVPDADALFERYRHIGLIDTRELQPARFLAAHCPRADDVARSDG